MQDDEPGAKPQRRGRVTGAGWLSLVIWSGLALAALELVLLVGAFLHGLSIPSKGPQGVNGGLLDRVGVGLFTDIGAANSLTLVVAAALAIIPSALGRRLSDPVDRAVGATLALALAVGALFAVASVIAVRGRLHVYAASGQAVTAPVRYSLFAYLVATLGPALVAFTISIVGLRWHSGLRGRA